MRNAIEVDHASKIYRRFGHKRQFATLKSALLRCSLIRDLRPEETFTAVSDVSFTVPPGTTLGVIGRNGSGKSTMLKLVAGITKPTSGDVRVNGRISALIELGAGFHPEISGRENVFINGIMLGLSKREVAKRFDEIVAVGDEGFTHRCLDKFAEFKRRGKTILLVTHALSMVERFCDEALWLDAGTKQGLGDPKRINDTYITAVERTEEQQLAATDARAQELTVPVSPDEPASAVLPDHPVESAAAPANMFLAAEGRWGSREVEITDVALSSGDGERGHVFHSGDRLDIRMRVHAPLPIEDFVIGVGLFNAEGVCCYGTNTSIEEYTSELLHGDGEVTITIDSLDLVEGTYKVDVAVHRLDGYPYDYHRLLYTFRVKSRTKDVGIYRPRHSWQFSDGIKVSRQPGELP